MGDMALKCHRGIRPELFGVQSLEQPSRRAPVALTGDFLLLVLLVLGLLRDDARELLLALRFGLLDFDHEMGIRRVGVLQSPSSPLLERRPTDPARDGRRVRVASIADQLADSLDAVLRALRGSTDHALRHDYALS